MIWENSKEHKVNILVVIFLRSLGSSIGIFPLKWLIVSFGLANVSILFSIAQGFRKPIINTVFPYLFKLSYIIC